MYLQVMKSWTRPDKAVLAHNCVCTCVYTQRVVQLLLSWCHYSTLSCVIVCVHVTLQHPVSTLHTTTAYDHLLKILVVGDRGSNKRALLRKYIGDTEMSETTTLGKYPVSFPCHCSMPPYLHSHVTASFPCNLISRPLYSYSSLVPRLFPPPVFGRMLYAKTEGEGLGERVTCVTSGRREGRCEGGGDRSL